MVLWFHFSRKDGILVSHYVKYFLISMVHPHCGANQTNSLRSLKWLPLVHDYVIAGVLVMCTYDFLSSGIDMLASVCCPAYPLVGNTKHLCSHLSPKL